MRSSLLAALFLLLATPAAQAQGDPLQPVLDLAEGGLMGEAKDGIAPRSAGNLAIPWTLTFPTAPTAAAELAQDAAISWTVACDAPLGIAAPPTPVQPIPGEATYTGDATITLEPQDDTPGVRDIACTVTGDFAGATTQASASVQSTVRVLFDGNMSFAVQAAERQSGPQKLIPYHIEVTNNGNARALVTWEVVGSPGGKWNILPPEHIVLEPGQTLTAVAAVATPYENGYVSGKGSFVLRAVTSAAEAPDQPGQGADLQLHATAKGWYVPGPGPALLATALALAVAIVRR